MDDKELQIQIKERLEMLSADIQEALLSAKTGENVTTIAKENELSLEQTDRLFLEVFMVMMGIEPLKDFELTISRSLEIPQERAGIIGEHVRYRIFNEIKTSLEEMQIFDEENEDKKEVAYLPQNKTENTIPQAPENNTPPQNLPTGNIDARDQIANKLTGIIKPPPITLPDKKPDVPQTPIPQKPPINVPKYTDDPYREPLE